MSRQKKPFSKSVSAPSILDQARDELFSHILRCGVVEADVDQQKEWLDDTMQYLAERYQDLDEEQLTQVRLLGERFCRPVTRKAEVAGSSAE